MPSKRKKMRKEKRKLIFCICIRRPPSLRPVNGFMVSLSSLQHDSDENTAQLASKRVFRQNFQGRAKQILLISTIGNVLKTVWKRWSMVHVGFKGFLHSLQSSENPRNLSKWLEKSSYPIQLLIRALGENSFAFPRKLRSLGELHSLKKKKTSPMTIMTLLAVLLVGGGGGGGRGKGVQTPCPLSLAFPARCFLCNYTLL